MKPMHPSPAEILADRYIPIVIQRYKELSRNKRQSLLTIFLNIDHMEVVVLTAEFESRSGYGQSGFVPLPTQPTVLFA